MPAEELNDGLAKFTMKKGMPSPNKLGKQGSTAFKQGLRNISEHLAMEASLPSTMVGREGMTKWDSIAQTIMDRAEHGERWFIKFAVDRLFGRVPLEIDLKQAPIDLSKNDSRELLARVERLRAMLLEAEAAAGRPSRSTPRWSSQNTEPENIRYPASLYPEVHQPRCPATSTSDVTR